MRTGLWIGMGLAAFAAAAPSFAQSAGGGQPHAPPPVRLPGDNVRNPDGSLVGNEPLTARRADQRTTDDIALHRSSEHGHRLRAVPAQASDIVAGRPVADIGGVAIGTVASVDGTSAVVRTEAGSVAVPLDSFGKAKDMLVLGITKAQFDDLMRGASATAPAG